MRPALARFLSPLLATALLVLVGPAAGAQEPGPPVAAPSAPAKDEKPKAERAKDEKTKDGKPAAAKPAAAKPEKGDSKEKPRAATAKSGKNGKQAEPAPVVRTHAGCPCEQQPGGACKCTEFRLAWRRADGSVWGVTSRPTLAELLSERGRLRARFSIDDPDWRNPGEPYCRGCGPAAPGELTPARQVLREAALQQRRAAEERVVRLGRAADKPGEVRAGVNLVPLSKRLAEIGAAFEQAEANGFQSSEGLRLAFASFDREESRWARGTAAAPVVAAATPAGPTSPAAVDPQPGNPAPAPAPRPRPEKTRAGRTIDPALDEPLREAINAGTPAKVKELLERGADPDVRFASNANLTPLMWAAVDGLDEIVSLLVQAGADLEARDGKGATALIYAIRTSGDPVKLTRLLLVAGASLDVKSAAGRSPLEEARQRGLPDLVDLIARAGAKK